MLTSIAGRSSTAHLSVATRRWGERVLGFCCLLLFCGCHAFSGSEDTGMRVQFVTEGGIAHFPGLSKPVVIDSARLSEDKATELRRLVEGAQFFSLPPQANKPQRGAADYFRYTITVEEGERRHTVQVTDPVADSGLRELVAFLRAQAKAQRAGGEAPR